MARARQPEPWAPNLTWVLDDLAIGGRFPGERAERLALDHEVAAVIDLRSEDRDDEAILRQHGIAFLHLPTDDHQAPGVGHLDDGVLFARAHLDRGKRVLVHCEHGIGRSATLALCIMVDRGFEPLLALERAKSLRALVSPSPAQYRCWAAWLARHARENRHGWEVPSFEAFAAIAYRHLPGRG